jgi:hypothetical protein
MIDVRVRWNLKNSTNLVTEILSIFVDFTTFYQKSAKNLMV